MLQCYETAQLVRRRHAEPDGAQSNPLLVPSISGYDFTGYRCLQTCTSSQFTNFTSTIAGLLRCYLTLTRSFSQCLR